MMDLIHIETYNIQMIPQAYQRPVACSWTPSPLG